MKTTVYSSDRQTHFFKELRSIFADIRNSNFLASQMTKRDIQALHRQSFLGYFWALAPVLLNSMVWLFLNGSGVVTVKITDGIPYPVFVILGTTIWNIFAESIQTPITAVNAGRGIMSKINFPKEALLLTGLYKNFFNLLVKMIPIIVILVVYQIVPNWNILFFPLYLFAIILLGFSIGLFLTPIGLIYTDVGKAISAVIPFMMYITPVVFAAPKGGIFKFLFQLNPMTYLITDTRNILVGKDPQYLFFTLGALLVSTIVLMISLVIFRKSMPIIIEKIAG